MPTLPSRLLVASARIGWGAVLLLAAACSDPCEDAVADLCEKACECSGEAECGVTFGQDGNGISLGFDSADDCAALFNHGCEEEEIDGDACGGDVGGAECGQNGLIVPASCAGTN